MAGKLVQRTWQDDDGNKHQTVEIQVTHVGPDLQFATRGDEAHQRVPGPCGSCRVIFSSPGEREPGSAGLRRVVRPRRV